MRVVLTITSGPREGTKLLLTPHQSLTIGRTERADVALPSDTKLSGCHFEVLADHTGCILRDLESTNGTWVNEEAVHQAVLRDGDIIVAGETEFRISIEGERSQSTTIRTVVDLSRSRGGTKAAESQAIFFTTEDCPSGLVRCWGQAAELAPAALAESFGRLVPAHAIYDPHKSGVELPGDVPSEVLLDWLPPRVQAELSPVLYTYQQCDSSSELVSQAWGSDAVILFFGQVSARKLAEQLRSTIRSRADDQSILGCCWPSVLGHLLYAGPSSSWGNLLKDVEAILMESAQQPDRWQIFGAAELPQRLESLGLKPAPRTSSDTAASPAAPASP